MDKIEEIRQKELEVQKKQLFAQRVTAAASVASAVAAHKQAAATEEIQHQIAADSERNRLHQMLMAVQQEKMAEEQRLTNFRNTILATLPLLKDEEEKRQYLTEQLLPKLKEGIDVPKLSPIAVISLVADKWNSKGTLNNCLENEAGQDLKNLLSDGKDLLERTERWIEKHKAREKKVNEFQEAQGRLNKLERPFGFRDIVKITLWAILIFLISYIAFSAIFTSGNDTTAQEDSQYLKSPSYDAVYLDAAHSLFPGSIVLGTILHFWLKRRKTTNLKAKVKLLTPPDDLPLKKEKEEMEKKFKLQDEKWEPLRPQIANFIMECNQEFIKGDPRSVLLEIIAAFLKSRVNELQSFLPPSSRLSEGHYAQYFIDEADVQKFREGQATIENDLKKLLLPFYRGQRIVLGDTEALIEAEQIRAFALGNIESAVEAERSRDRIIEAKNKIRTVDEKYQPNKTATQIAEDFKSKIKDKRIFFHPYIPPKMLGGIGTTYAKAACEKNDAIICVIDNTFFARNASDGIAITEDAIYWNGLGKANKMKSMPFRDVRQITLVGGVLEINNQVRILAMPERNSMEQIVAMINALRDLA